MTYQHLSQTERYQIYILMKDGKTQSQIAQLMDRHKSTISRELARNTGNRGYRPRQACLLAQERSLGSRNATQITIAEWGKTVDCLLEKWSPVQIANQVGISHETIYRHVYADKAAGGSLYQQLRCQKKRKKRYASGRERRGQIIGRRPISERPAHIETRAQVGHWEGDTVIGAAHKQAVVTLVERKSGYAVLAKVKNKTSDLVSAAIISKLSPLAPLVKTMTFDNGKEFAGHSTIDTALNSTTYFADPFASWQRGSNENFNGLLRQYIPKKRALTTVTDKELRMIQDQLNNRPRKRLGFKTPSEVFTQSLNRVALRV
ncbi:IS30 family transposase [Polynucleobacter sp. MG-28-Ekke-A2]|uniref:IS30 family transposase n=1 Tax=Polynucleobacter sp. MG-28-Ekke-A2 TaxID=3108276 RepID=UPI002B238AD1|nr:IS30 family transposase [Polynucleobacter sp. MG-28-Ekke-A2]MEA9602388.1 IS30 family transposase [Polynucleobacter sp. MG-28-Ekke-A2]